jgi:hypothetical protein
VKILAVLFDGAVDFITLSRFNRRSPGNISSRGNSRSRLKSIKEEIQVRGECLFPYFIRTKPYGIIAIRIFPRGQAKDHRREHFSFLSSPKHQASNYFNLGLTSFQVEVKRTFDGKTRLTILKEEETMGFPAGAKATAPS